MKHGTQVSQHFEANLLAISQGHLGVSVQPECLAVVHPVAHQGGCAGAALAVVKNVSVLREFEVLGQKYALTQVRRRGDKENQQSSGIHRGGSHGQPFASWPFANQKRQPQAAVQQGSQQQAPLDSDPWHQHEYRQERAQNRARGVERKEQTNAPPKVSYVTPIHAAQQRKGRSHQDRWHEHRQKRHALDR